MLCSYGYDVSRCFDCPYGNSAHIPEGYEGWTNTVIKDTLVMDTPLVYPGPRCSATEANLATFCYLNC